MAKAKKAAKAAAKKASSAKGEVLVVTSKVRAYVRSKDVNMSSEVIPALNDVIQALLDKAVKRTEGNKRKTLRPQDL